MVNDTAVYAGLTILDKLFVRDQGDDLNSVMARLEDAINAYPGLLIGFRNVSCQFAAESFFAL